MIESQLYDLISEKSKISVMNKKMKDRNQIQQLSQSIIISRENSKKIPNFESVVENDKMSNSSGVKINNLDQSINSDVPVEKK